MPQNWTFPRRTDLWPSAFPTPVPTALLKREPAYPCVEVDCFRAPSVIEAPF